MTKFLPPLIGLLLALLVGTICAVPSIEPKSVLTTSPLRDVEDSSNYNNNYYYYYNNNKSVLPELRGGASEEEPEEEDEAFEEDNSNNNDLVGVVLDTAFEVSHRAMILCGKMSIQVYFALKRAVYAGLHPSEYDDDDDDKEISLLGAFEDDEVIVDSEDGSVTTTTAVTPLQTKLLRLTVRLAKLSANCMKRMAKAAIAFDETDPELVDSSMVKVEQATDKILQTTSMLSSKLYKLKTKFQRDQEEESLYDDDEEEEMEEEVIEVTPVESSKKNKKSKKAEVVVEVSTVPVAATTEEQEEPQVTVEVVTASSPPPTTLPVAVSGGHQKHQATAAITSSRTILNPIQRFVRSRVVSGVAIGLCTVLLWESALKSGRLSSMAQVAGSTALSKVQYLSGTSKAWIQSINNKRRNRKKNN